jgi:hypothetical protein
MVLYISMPEFERGDRPEHEDSSSGHIGKDVPVFKPILRGNGGVLPPDKPQEQAPAIVPPSTRKQETAASSRPGREAHAGPNAGDLAVSSISDDDSQLPAERGGESETGEVAEPPPPAASDSMQPPVEPPRGGSEAADDIPDKPSFFSIASFYHERPRNDDEKERVRATYTRRFSELCDTYADYKQVLVADGKASEYLEMERQSPQGVTTIVLWTESEILTVHTKDREGNEAQCDFRLGAEDSYLRRHDYALSGPTEPAPRVDPRPNREIVEDLTQDYAKQSEEYWDRYDRRLTGHHVGEGQMAHLADILAIVEPPVITAVNLCEAAEERNSLESKVTIGDALQAAETYKRDMHRYIKKHKPLKLTMTDDSGTSHPEGVALIITDADAIKAGVEQPGTYPTVIISASFDAPAPYVARHFPSYEGPQLRKRMTITYSVERDELWITVTQNLTTVNNEPVQFPKPPIRLRGDTRDCAMINWFLRRPQVVKAQPET